MIENDNGTTDNAETDNTEDAQTNEIPDIDSKYRLILIAAQRSKQLQKGAQPRIDVDPRKIKNTRIALEEIKHNKVPFKITKEK